jgi:hypothetical protein
MVTVTTQQAEVDEVNITEAEESLAEMEIKRKAESSITEA